MILLLPLIGQFLVVGIYEMDSDRVILNVPKELAVFVLEYVLENSDEKFRIGDKEFSIDSLLDEIVKPQARPRKLVVELEEDENLVFIKLPLWMAERLHSFIVVTGEDKYNVNRTKELIRNIISNIKETEGCFTLMEFDKVNRKLKIFIE